MSSVTALDAIHHHPCAISYASFIVKGLPEAMKPFTRDDDGGNDNEGQGLKAQLHNAAFWKLHITYCTH